MDQDQDQDQGCLLLTLLHNLLQTLYQVTMMKYHLQDQGSRIMDQDQGCLLLTPLHNLLQTLYQVTMLKYHLQDQGSIIRIRIVDGVPC